MSSSSAAVQDHSLLKQFAARPDFPALVFLLVVFVGFSLFVPSFWSLGNLVNTMRQTAPIAIVALAVNQIIIAGEIDISMGSMVAVLAFIFAGISEATGMPWLAMAITLACGGAFGSVNGVLATVLGIPAIIATLGTLMILRGALLIGAGSITLYASEATRIFGNGRIVGVPVEVWIFLGVFVYFALLASQSRYGRRVLAVGGNARAARDIGIPVNAVRFWAYVQVGLCCALAAPVFVGQVAAMTANVGAGFELKVIATVVLGGTSLSGGRGTVLAPVIGAVLLSLILNATALVRLPPTFESLILGVIILISVAFIGVRARHQERAS